jgi:hypothetical protein
MITPEAARFLAFSFWGREFVNELASGLLAIRAETLD